ncbi:hypothetical protein [Bacillus cereus]|nr:hypothetical protein [Bacillus cereus]
MKKVSVPSLWLMIIPVAFPQISETMVVFTRVCILNDRAENSV